MSSIFAIVLAGLAGVVFGTFGAGGSAMLVPIFVYVLGMPARLALAVALAILVAMGTVTALAHARAGHIEPRVGALWAGFGWVGAFAGGHAAGRIPEPVLLSLFAAAVLAAALRMLKPVREDRASGPRRPAVGALAGLGVGLFTGTLGMGGGFLLVPALVILGGLDMRRAIGTSAMIIAINAAGGVAGFAGHTPFWTGTAPFVALAAVLGNLAGARLSHRVPVHRLRPAFAVLLLVIGVAMMVREVEHLAAEHKRGGERVARVRRETGSAVAFSPAARRSRDTSSPENVPPGGSSP